MCVLFYKNIKKWLQNITAHVSSSEATNSTAIVRFRLQGTTAITSSSATAAADLLLGN